MKFIDEAQSAQKPFFLYLAHNAPHFPLQAPAETIAKFRGKYQAGWDALRLARHKKQIEMGIVDKAWVAAPRPADITAWDEVPSEERDRFDHIMATYAACVYRVDQAVGDLVAGLKARNSFDNTLIMFMSDNGGNAESGPKGKTNGDPSDAKSDWFCGESWAYLQNTPFRKYKHYNHEGGIASSFIAHWPKGITQRGAIRTEPSHLIDVMATCVDVGEADYPQKLDGKVVQPMEGKSLVPVFAGKPIQREAIFWNTRRQRCRTYGRLEARAAWTRRTVGVVRLEIRPNRTKQPGCDSAGSNPVNVHRLGNMG